MKLLITILSMVVFSNAAIAFDLHAARKTNKVIELDTGFLKAKDPQTKSDVDAINLKRKAAYKKIHSKLKPAERAKVTVDDIGKKAAKKIKASMSK